MPLVSRRSGLPRIITALRLHETVHTDEGGALGSGLSDPFPSARWLSGRYSGISVISATTGLWSDTLWRGKHSDVAPATRPDPSGLDASAWNERGGASCNFQKIHRRRLVNPRQPRSQAHATTTADRCVSGGESFALPYVFVQGGSGGCKYGTARVFRRSWVLMQTPALNRWTQQ